MAAPFCQSRQQGLKTLFYTFLSTGWGALLAAPVLLNQIEFFLLSTRTVIPGSWSIAEVFRGPLSLSGVFPWLLGTFRTLDLSKAVGLGNLGFSLFVGSVPFVLAAIGATVTFFAKRTASLADRAAVFLVVGYLVQISTPLGNFFYTRLSPLACLGLAVLVS